MKKLISACLAASLFLNIPGPACYQAIAQAAQMSSSGATPPNPGSSAAGPAGMAVPERAFPLNNSLNNTELSGDPALIQSAPLGSSLPSPSEALPQPDRAAEPLAVADGNGPIPRISSQDRGQNKEAEEPPGRKIAFLADLSALAHQAFQTINPIRYFSSAYDGGRRDPSPEPASEETEAPEAQKSAPVKSQGAIAEEAQALFRLRYDVQRDARGILVDKMGGDVGDGILHRDVRRVLNRLLKAAGLPKEAAQVFIGNSFLPNAFTTVVPSEAKYLQNNASIAKAFRISNVFLSLGLLRSLDNEGQLAFILAHELMHNWKGHLKNFSGAGHVFLGHFHELEADGEALKLMAAAGYDPQDGIDALYALDREYERLEKEYSLLRQDKNDVMEALRQLRDIHPHTDIRRAEMEKKYIKEARELYRPLPVPDHPVWMRRRLQAERPSRHDRFQNRLYKALGSGTIEEGVYSLEKFIERERAQGDIGIESYAIIEEAYRKLSHRARTVDELRPVEISVLRERYGDAFPSKRLKSDLITRQLDLLLAAMASPPQAAPNASVASPLRMAGKISGRPDLEAAYQAASSLLESEFDSKNRKAFGALQSMAVRFRRAAGVVLACELGRPPSSAEIEGELIQHLPSFWGRAIHLAVASDPGTLELNATLSTLGPDIDVESFLSATQGAGGKQRRAGVLYLLDLISDRPGLESASRALASGKYLALNPLDGRQARFNRDVVFHLWRAADRVLSLEAGRSAQPEEIQAELLAIMPASWKKLVVHVRLSRSRTAATWAATGGQTLASFLHVSAQLSERSREAGTLRLLGAIRDRYQLDSAFKTLSREAENLGLDIGPGSDRASVITLQVAGKLWGATRRILTQELGRPALPEEIIDELRGKLALSWLKSYQTGFALQIVESVFGPRAYRSSKYRPSELVARLTGLPEPSRETPSDRKLDSAATLPGLLVWSQRHYSAPAFKIVNNKPVYNYEHYYLRGLSSPSLEDQLDLMYLFTHDFDSIVIDYPPFIRLLRQEGKLREFMEASLRDLALAVKRKINGAATFEERREHLNWYEAKVKTLLHRCLYGARDFKVIRETLETVWIHVEALLQAEEINAAYGDSNRSHIAQTLFDETSIALRQAVVGADLAGQRPDREELRKTTELVRRIESSLQDFSTSDLIQAHALKLSDRLGNGRAYMKAYRRAIQSAVAVVGFWALFHGRLLRGWNKTARWFDGHGGNWWWLIGVPLLWLAVPLIWAIFPAAVFAAIFGYFIFKLSSWAYQRLVDKFPRARYLPNLPKEAARSLRSADFIHFLALIGDPHADPDTKLMAVALLDRLDLSKDYRTHGEDYFGRDIKMRAAAAVGRWLLEDISQTAHDRESLRRLTRCMLRLSDLHPGLLQPDLETEGSYDNAFRSGAEFIKRNETYRSLAKGEHPFRGVNTRWASELVKRLDAENAWPSDFSEKMDLLDFLNSSGEFNDELDNRIIEHAHSDPKAFYAWYKNDLKKLARLGGDDWQNDGLGGRQPAKYDTIETPFGALPVPKAFPLRIVRNPALRAKLFDPELLPEARLGEKPVRRSLHEWFNGYRRLLKAYWRARKYFSPLFLNGLRGEDAMEDKIFDVLEEVDRIATQQAKEANERWERGKFSVEEVLFFDDGSDTFDDSNAKEYWQTLRAHEKEEFVVAYKRYIKNNAMRALLELYNAYAGVQEPLLGMILDNYPEATRSRDELLERVIKARRLSGGRLAFLESHKSYRMPNPLRIAEKHLLDQAVIQMGKFSAAEKVDILLHVAKIERLSEEEMRRFNRRILSRDRRKIARDYGSLRSISQMENYMSLLHAQDRALIVHALFYGEHSLHKSPAEVKRLYEKLVIENRDLPPFLEKVFRALFEIYTDDEKARLISEIAALDDVSSRLKGPQIVRVALKNAGVTGKKIAQVLATHTGLIPPEYAQVLEEFKENAQDMAKMRAYESMQDRLRALAPPVGSPEEQDDLSLQKLDEVSREALPENNTERKIGEAARLRLVRQVRFLLKEQGRKIRWVEFIGPELGAGSIKLVYKIELDDGRVWVAKIRAPGAAYSTAREFEIIDLLIAKLESQGDLDLPAARQLLDEVKALVKAEMNFVDEAEKETAMLARVRSRPWFARIFFPVPYVPKPHPTYVGEDIMIEEFVPTKRFSELPVASIFGPSRSKIAKRTVEEGMFALVYDGWLEPDPHTGNRHARGGWSYRFRTKLVVMDLGQGSRQPIELLKPLMKAAVALEDKDITGSARQLFPILNLAPKHDAAKVLAQIEAGLLERPDAGTIDRLMDGLLAAEKLGVLAHPEYASLQKAMVLYTGYSEYLPKDYLMHALESALAARLLRDHSISLSQLFKLWVKKAIYGRAAIRAELEPMIDGIKE